MAIFGSLSDIDLISLLQMLEGRTGRLFIEVKGKKLSLLLHGRAVVSARKNGEEIPVRAVVDELLNVWRIRSGSFEFIPTPPPPHSGSGPRIGEIALKIAILRDEEEGIAKGILPHLDACFRAVADPPLLPDSDLNHKFSLLLPHLREGISPREASEVLDISPREAQLLFLKLQLSGAVKPFLLRSPKSSSNSDRSGIARRLLKALRRRFFA